MERITRQTFQAVRLLASRKGSRNGRKNLRVIRAKCKSPPSIAETKIRTKRCFLPFEIPKIQNEKYLLQNTTEIGGSFKWLEDSDVWFL